MENEIQPEIAEVYDNVGRVAGGGESLNRDSRDYRMAMFRVCEPNTIMQTMCAIIVDRIVRSNIASAYFIWLFKKIIADFTHQRPHGSAPLMH